MCSLPCKPKWSASIGSSTHIANLPLDRRLLKLSISGGFAMNKRCSLLRLMTAVVVALAMTTLLGIPAALAQGQKVLKFIPQADLRILDPITTTEIGRASCRERV